MRLKKIAKKRNLKLINLNEEFKKIKSQNKFEFPEDLMKKFKKYLGIEAINV